MADWPYNTARWQKLRTAKLSTDPLCKVCAKRGLVKPASHVDHIKAISDGGPAFPSLDGLQSLCPACHSRKTVRGTEAGAARTTKPMKGCDANGSPLDPAHPWAEKSLGAERVGPPVDIQNQLVLRKKNG